MEFLKWIYVADIFCVVVVNYRRPNIFKNYSFQNKLRKNQVYDP